MGLRVFNSLSKKIEDFVPLVPGQVGFYCCGPTVYNHVHIGNLRAYLFQDLFKRYLEYSGFEVNHVMNITDVDDKTIRDSRAAGRNLGEFTDFYTKAFISDLQVLGVKPANHMPKATDTIKEMVEIIKELLKSGHAYQAESGDIYFKISSFDNYGQLANIEKLQLKANASGRMVQADEYEKENASDFALWKAYDEQDGDVFWETELGRGRPGWHIECSAMSRKFLGDTFDIHAGGIDLLFPHHTNEIAQSECATGKPFVRYWLHNYHLIVNGKKMSKSLGNFFTLKDLLDKGYDPQVIRFELLKVHYRTQLDFREDGLIQGAQTLSKYWELMEKLEEPKKGANWSDLDELINRSDQEFRSAMDDDLNISSALAVTFDFVNQVNKNLEKLSSKDRARAKALLEGWNSVLGVIERDYGELSDQCKQLISERESARAAKDFKRSDEIRDKLIELGILIKDTPSGTKWRRVV